MKNKILTLIQIILIIIIIVSAMEIIKWIIYNNKSKNILDDLSSSVSISYENKNADTLTESVALESLKYNIDFENLKSKNPDTVAWIKINGTSIEYPIVQTKNNKTTAGDEKENLDVGSQ